MKDTKTEEKKRREHLQTPSHGQTATSTVVDNSHVEEGDFVRCLVPANFPSAPSMSDTYLSKNAIAY